MSKSPECAYADGTLCSCGSFAGAFWTCFTPGAACPTLVPNMGTACAPGQTGCAYEGCKLEASCMSGVWTWFQVAC
jgi:hypothetical protein